MSRGGLAAALTPATRGLRWAFWAVLALGLLLRRWLACEVVTLGAGLHERPPLDPWLYHREGRLVRPRPRPWRRSRPIPSTARGPARGWPAGPGSPATWPRTSGPTPSACRRAGARAEARAVLENLRRFAPDSAVLREGLRALDEEE